MAQWVVVEEFEDRLRPIERFEGTVVEARRRLYETACTHKFSEGLQQRRREVFRVHDDMYFVEVKGGLGTYRLRYWLAERVWGTEAAS
ncbi:hypothetical protein [Streptomyces caeruleatus]|uniref:Uncharacterized protein n=1 Tax=Streptomyces caeruleatus TaxID=661399 RepID=A0A117RQ67_9ACTN|nr:hypothetical protein [Streptomyces caeruleatus]KUO03227.1 hypothetical protein AQJ67_15940 [Streptomyces caeruleatus]